MKPPHAFNPTSLAVEDYLKRTAHAKESVMLTTVDAQGRVGNVVIYQGELWSARDTQGVGELALLRLMNERVCLHVEPLSELDRGPRTITERRQVLFMRASFEAQAALDPADDSPTCVLLPKPRDVRAERISELLKTSDSPKRHTIPPVRPLPAPKHVPHEVLTPHEARGSDRSPTTLSPLTFDAKAEVTQTSVVSVENPSLALTPKPRPRRFRLSKPAAAALMFCTTAGIASVWSSASAPNAPVSALAVATQDRAQTANSASPEQPRETANASTLVTKTLGLAAPPRQGENSTPSGTNEPLQTKPPSAVVARLRSVGSSNSLNGIDLPRYVYSIGGQFVRCYDWATERAGREALGNVSVRVRLNDEGTVDSSVATGAKIRGLNSCVADVSARLPALMHVPHAANTLHWVVAFENN